MIAVTEYLVNEEIRDREVRLIGENGEQLGIMSSAAALNIAVEKDLDLVKIAPGSNPPVCKIMDYGKYRFEQSKREKEARKNQRVIEIKEIRMSPSIGENDFLVKLKNGQKFLADGDRVKVTVRFRGREMAHTNIGEQLLCRQVRRAGESRQAAEAGGAQYVHLPLPEAAGPREETRQAERRKASARRGSQRVSKPREGATKAMPKLKSHSGAKKRFNLTKTGKVKRAHAFKSHILTKKDTKRKRCLRQGAYADVTNESAIKRMIPYK